MQKVDATGAVQWTVNGVGISTRATVQKLPQIASDGSGGAIVTWSDYRNGTDSNIYAQRVDATGAVQWAANGVAISTATGNQGSPQIVADGSGGAIITWSDPRSGNYDIYAQKINASGAVQWTANGIVVSAAALDQHSPHVVTDGSGGAIVTWYDTRGGADIYAQRVGATGAVQWTANGVIISPSAGDQVNPQITTDGSGGAIIIWRDGSWPNIDIYAQRVNAAGAVQWTTNGVAICAATDAQYSPQIVADASGGAIISWEDNRNILPAGFRNIYAQRVDASGAVQWTTNGVVVVSGDPQDAQIAVDGSDDAIITWYESNGYDFDIYAQRVGANGTVQWTVDGIAVSTAVGNQETPQIVADGSSGAIITWRDIRNGTDMDDIYAQRVYANGNLSVGIVTPSTGPNGSISPDTPQEVPIGMTSQFTVTPDTGYTASVGGTCGGTLVGDVYTTNAITADCTVFATFTLNNYTVTASVDAHGTLDSTSQTVDHGSITSFMVTPETGYTTDTVVGGNCPVGSWSGQTYTTGTIVGACTVSFTHTINSYTVTPSAGPDGDILPDTPQAVTHDSTTQFTLIPEGGYVVTIGGTCGGTLNGNTYTTNAITGDCSVEAAFELGFTVTPSAGANGTIAPDTPQGIPTGATAQFTLTPDTGYSASVGGTCGGTLVGDIYTTNAITADCTVDATFTLNSYTVSTSAPADQGSFTPEFDTVDHGETTTFDVTAEEGYTIDTVTGCGGAWTGANPYETGPITADCTVEATFSVPEDCTFFIINTPGGKTIAICL